MSQDSQSSEFLESVPTVFTKQSGILGAGIPQGTVGTPCQSFVNRIPKKAGQCSQLQEKWSSSSGTRFDPFIHDTTL